MKLIGLGFVMVAIGFGLVFLTVLRLIPPSYLLLFLAYALSLGGLALGVAGVIQVRGHRPEP